MSVNCGAFFGFPRNSYMTSCLDTETYVNFNTAFLIMCENILNTENTYDLELCQNLY